MRIDTPAIICSLRSHGEHGAVVRMMTPANGLQAAYVRGARGRRMRPVLIAGNSVEARLSWRAPGQLAQAEVELVRSRAPLAAEPLAAAAIAWVTALTATVLPEGQDHPRVHSALDGLLAAIEAAPSASGWGAALVRFELLLLAELGFGLDLAACALTGAAEGLVAVSPSSGRAVSASAAQPYAGRLLPLPLFVHGGGEASRPEIVAGLRLSGHFLLRDLLTERAAAVGEARRRLVERIERAAEN